MHVYLVMRHVDYEGSEVVNIFRDRADAEALVERMMDDRVPYTSTLSGDERFMEWYEVDRWEVL